MLKKALLFAVITVAFISLITTTNHDHLTINTVGEKVKVDLYSESLCPDCLAFIKSSLKTAANTKDFWKICDFNLYPYGNAKRSQNGSLWNFTCQHGVKECQGNLIEACANKKATDHNTQAIPFFICL